MNDDLVPMVQTPRSPSLGDRLRNIASQLRQENEIQIKATARILGAAAQMAQNHDQLIDKVVEIVQEDLAQSQKPTDLYTVQNLQQQFKTLKAAKAHFQVKASSWATLVEKLNAASATPSPPESPLQSTVVQRLEGIEQEIQTIRQELTQIHQLLAVFLQKL